MKLIAIDFRPPETATLRGMGTVIARVNLRFDIGIEWLDLPLVRNRLGLFIVWNFTGKFKGEPQMHLRPGPFRRQLESLIHRAYFDRKPIVPSTRGWSHAG